MPLHTREDALAVARGLGWEVVGVSGKGYTKLHCPCGKHKRWLHKTPSNPNHFKEAISYMRRQVCFPPGPVVDMADKRLGQQLPGKVRGKRSRRFL